jgi:hypothetical protein
VSNPPPILGSEAFQLKFSVQAGTSMKFYCHLKGPVPSPARAAFSDLQVECYRSPLISTVPAQRRKRTEELHGLGFSGRSQLCTRPGTEVRSRPTHLCACLDHSTW